MNFGRNGYESSPDGDGPAVSNLAEEGATGSTGATSTGDSESDRGTMNVSAFDAGYIEGDK